MAIKAKFLAKDVSVSGFPFEIKKTATYPYAPMSEDEILQKLESSRKHAKEGRYREADDVIADMRVKYGI